MLTIPRSFQSRLQRIYPSQHLKLCLSEHAGTPSGACGRRNLMMWGPEGPIAIRVTSGGECIVAFQHGF